LLDKWMEGEIERIWKGCWRIFVGGGGIWAVFPSAPRLTLDGSFWILERFAGEKFGGFLAGEKPKRVDA